MESNTSLSNDVTTDYYRHVLYGLSLLEGNHFTVGTQPEKPYISFTNVSSNGQVNEAEGFIHQILLYIAYKYQFKFNYVPSGDKAYGGFVNGSWNGLVGMLYRGEIDLAAASLSVTYPRSQVVKFSVPFEDTPVSLLIPYPELDNMELIYGIFRPFKYEVWLLIVACLLAVSVSIWKILMWEQAIYYKRKDNTIQTMGFNDSFWSLLEFHNIADQSRFPIRLLMSVWCLVSVVLVNAYSSTVTSYLMTPRYHSIVDSVEDIANLLRPIFMVRLGTSPEATVLNANSGVLLKIGDSLRKYPIELRLPSLTKIEKAAELVIEYQRTFTAQKSTLLAFMEEDLKATGQCRVYLAKKPWDTSQQALALPKFSPVVSTFNREINWMRDVGLLDYWTRRYYPGRNKCSEPLSTEISNQTRLSLSYLSSAFILLGCGLLISAIVFLIEVWVSKYLP